MYLDGFKTVSWNINLDYIESRDKSQYSNSCIVYVFIYVRTFYISRAVLLQLMPQECKGKEEELRINSRKKNKVQRTIYRIIESFFFITRYAQYCAKRIGCGEFKRLPNLRFATSGVARIFRLGVPRAEGVFELISTLATPLFATQFSGPLRCRIRRYWDNCLPNCFFWLSLKVLCQKYTSNRYFLNHKENSRS